MRPNLSLERNNKSEQSLLASRRCKPRYVRRSLYEKWAIEGILLMYMRCTPSNQLISLTLFGDHIEDNQAKGEYRLQRGETRI